MKKIKKISIVIIMLISLFSIFSNTYVNASEINLTKSANNEKENDLLESDYIMMYDAKTGVTSKVDMKKVLKQNLIKSKNIKTNYTNGYSPEVNALDKNIILSSSSSTERVYPTQSPYNKAFKCVYYSNNNERGDASGAIVGLRVGLTAAHCIFNENDNNAVFKNWTCYVGYDSGNYWGTPTGWDKVYYDSRYFDNHDKRYDWAILVLQADSTVGWFGVQSYGSTSDLNNMDITMLGYPADSNLGFNGAYEYRVTSKAGLSVFTDIIRFNGLGASGFSGGPIYNSSEYIVAVMCSGDNQYCYAPRITSNMIEIIKSLK